MKAEIIKVKNDQSDCGYMIINKSDFDPDIHEEFKDGVQKKAKRGRRKKAEVTDDA